MSSFGEDRGSESKADMAPRVRENSPGGVQSYHDQGVRGEAGGRSRGSAINLSLGSAD